MAEVFIHHTAVVDEGAKIGVGSKVWHFVHVRGTAKLGNNVIVGKSSYIDEDVVIGSNVKIQNLVSIYNGVIIKNNVFVGPHVTFTNDLFPRAKGKWSIIKTCVEEGVSIGANATIICGVTLGKNSLIGAGSVVTHSVPSHGLVIGNPARLVGYVCVCANKIANSKLLKGEHHIICTKCEVKNIISVD